MASRNRETRRFLVRHIAGMLRAAITAKNPSPRNATWIPSTRDWALWVTARQSTKPLVEHERARGSKWVTVRYVESATPASDKMNAAHRTKFDGVVVTSEPGHVGSTFDAASTLLSAQTDRGRPFVNRQIVAVIRFAVPSTPFAMALVGLESSAAI